MKEKPSVNGSIAGMFKDFMQANQLDIPACNTYIDHWHVDNRVSIDELGLCLLFIHQKHPVAGLGLKISQHFKPTYSGLLGYLMLPCHSFNDAFSQLKKYYALMWSGFTLHIDNNDENLTITWDVPAVTLYKDHLQFLDIIRVGYELGISCFIKTIQQLTIDALIFQPTKISLPGTKPANTDIYQELFQCDVDFGCEHCSVSFHHSILEIPINLNNEFFKELLFKQAEAQLKSINQ